MQENTLFYYLVYELYIFFISDCEKVKIHSHCLSPSIKLNVVFGLLSQ